MKDDSDCSSLIKPGLDIPHRKNNKHLFKTQKPQHSWLLRSPSVVAKGTAVDSINYHTSQSSLLTSSSGGACPAFSPHYSYFTASANSHQRPASFCHAPSLHFISFSAMCACISVYLCVCVRATVMCMSLLLSKHHANRWAVERPRAILWQMRFPSFVPGADGADGSCHTVQARPEGGHQLSVLMNRLHKWALPLLTPSPFFFSSHHFIESISLHKFINVTWKINIKSLHITANLPQATRLMHGSHHFHPNQTIQ